MSHRTDFPSHICHHVDVTSHTYTLQTESLRGITAQHSVAPQRSLTRWLTSAGDDDARQPWRHCAAGVAAVHDRRWVPVSPRLSSRIPFQVEILQVDFCGMRSTIWLTAVSGKRNNQIIIQPWVFNSRKASGC